MKSRFKLIQMVILSVLLLLYLTACGSGFGISAVDTQTSGTIGSSGGTIEVTDPNSPIKGTKIVVPGDALDSGEWVTIQIDYEDELPIPIEDGTISASKVIVLTKDGRYNFKQPVTVTVPYTDDQLEAGDIPAVFYWDSTYNKYRSVGVKEIDTINKTVTFTTVHFSKFVVLAIKNLINSLLSVIDTDAGFRPGTDGFFHPNFGDYDSPGGSSLGMANYSVWYFDSKKALDGNGLYNKYRQGDPSKWEDDTNARELISRAYIASGRIWANLWRLADYTLEDDITGLLLITALNITKSPQTFILNGDNFGHAVTVYRYDLLEGKFYIYDSNFPNEEVTVYWNPVDGFSNYSKASTYPQINRFGFESLSSVLDANQFENLYEGAESNWLASEFAVINIASPELDTANIASISDPTSVTVTGTVSGGIKAANFLVYYVNGGTENIITLGDDASFSFTISNLTRSTSVMMVATDDPGNKWSAYAGFKEITVEVQEIFFTNLDFETGDFRGWNHETHTWQDTTPGSFTPEKSEAVSPGDDGSIPMVYSGTHSVRVNDYDGYSTISTISQSVVLTNLTRQQLKFHWAAVLEDHPLASPEDESYVDILVRDETAGTDLYSKHFYAGDPAFLEWIYEGNWRLIPWQEAVIDLSNAWGHRITIKVTAAAGRFGAYGGYVYVDGVE